LTEGRRNDVAAVVAVVAAGGSGGGGEDPCLGAWVVGKGGGAAVGMIGDACVYCALDSFLWKLNDDDMGSCES
jgi:hypothetical protein